MIGHRKFSNEVLVTLTTLEESNKARCVSTTLRPRFTRQRFNYLFNSGEAVRGASKSETSAKVRPRVVWVRIGISIIQLS